MRYNTQIQQWGFAAMNFGCFAKKIGFCKEFTDSLAPYRQELWTNSADNAPYFMMPDFFIQYYPLCHGTVPAEKIYPLMEEVFRIVCSEPAAARYASMLHYAFYHANPVLKLPWPTPEGIFGRNAGIFNLMVALSSFPLIREKHRSLNLPEKYFLDTCSWLGGTMGIYAAAHDGLPGHTLSQAYWFRNSIDGKLFRVGRLEYMPRPWGVDFPAVYRNRTNRSLFVLCPDGWAFDKQGFRVDPDTAKPDFTARLKFFDGKVTGTPITPYGKPVPEYETTLDLSEWEPICAPWEPVLNVHIPGGGGMTTEAVRSSLIEAVMFFHRYLKLDVKIFNCSSWLLNPVWEKELPDSNMAAMQRNVYMTPPRPPSGRPGMFFVYGDDDCDPRTRPRTTRLHQAFCRIFDRGEPLRSGLMFIPASDVEHYGAEYFRKKYTFAQEAVKI